MPNAPNEIAVIAQSSAVSGLWDEDQVRLIINSVLPEGSNVQDLKLFALISRRTGLDPFARQIYAIKDHGKLSAAATIDGLRLIAERTGKLQAVIGPYWCGDDGDWTDVWLKDENPKAAKVGIRREGFLEPLYAVVTWKSFSKNTPPWRNMPEHMLAKVAESHALRRAFPQELSGVYGEDELGATPAPPALTAESEVEVVDEQAPIVAETAEVVEIAPREMTDDQKRDTQMMLGRILEGIDTETGAKIIEQMKSEGIADRWALLDDPDAFERCLDIRRSITGEVSDGYQPEEVADGHEEEPAPAAETDGPFMSPRKQAAVHSLAKKANVSTSELKDIVASISSSKLADMTEAEYLEVCKILQDENALANFGGSESDIASLSADIQATFEAEVEPVEDGEE